MTLVARLARLLVPLLAPLAIQVLVSRLEPVSNAPIRTVWTALKITSSVLSANLALLQSTAFAQPALEIAWSVTPMEPTSVTFQGVRSGTPGSEATHALNVWWDARYATPHQSLPALVVPLALSCQPASVIFVPLDVPPAPRLLLARPACQALLFLVVHAMLPVHSPVLLATPIMDV